MLSIGKSKSAAAAIKYFQEELARGDYYVGRGELPGMWHGKAAEALGLSGEVTLEQFSALANNLHPETGKRLTGRTRENRIPGYDLTLGAPKSVTAMRDFFLVTGQKEKADSIERAFRESAADVMAMVEADMRVEVQGGGKRARRTTGNIVWASFFHTQGRPVKDKLLETDGAEEAYADRHMHQHCYVFNASQDGDRWRAGDFTQIYADRTYYQAQFFRILATKLQELGYGTERQSVSFELAGVSRETIEKFSRRTQEIAAEAAKRGITSAKGKRNLATVTRLEKDEGVSAQETLERFYARLSHPERETFRRIGEGDFKPPSGGGMSASEALDHAIRDMFAHQSVVNERRLIAEALKHSLGHVLTSDLESALRAHPELVPGDDADGQGIVTTREAQANDAFIKAFAAQHRQVPSFAEQRALQGLGEYSFAREWLSDEQKAVVRHVMTSTALVVAVRGGAGTGKTTAMQETADAIREATGKAVVAVAPTGKAAHGTLREDGFENADTLARLLVDATMQEEARGGIIYVDEAGLIGSRTMRALFELSERLGARVVLQGDTRQHGSVEAGDALRFLEERAGLHVAELNQVRRQLDPAHREAVETISEGKIAEGFRKLDAMGAVRELEREAIPTAVAEAYLAALDNAPKNEARSRTAHIIAPIHAQAEPITEHVRAGLKLRKALGEERSFTRLFSPNWTDAKRAAAYNYRPGQVVEFLQKTRGGFGKGERVTVFDVKDGQVWALKGSGDRAALVALPLAEAEQFQVYERRALELAVGDTVRITKGGKDALGKRLNTGELYDVQGFAEDGSLLLGKNPGEIARKLPAKDALHLTHGYVSTSHAAQGSTVNHVFIAQGADSFAASSREQFYVSVSRSRYSVSIFTDSKDELARAVQRSGARLFAADVQDKRLGAKLPQAPRPVAKTALELEQPKESGLLRHFRKALAASIELIDSLAEKGRAAAREFIFGGEGELAPALAGTPGTHVTPQELKDIRRHERSGHER